MKIREIDPNSDAEIDLVARRMRQTLVEVLGQEKGVSMYTMDWLTARVRWHLDSRKTNGRVFLFEEQKGKIVGHAMARIDHGTSFGYFSTIFVEPQYRKRGIATNLMKHVEDWFLSSQMSEIIYNTAINHKALIALFKSQGYSIAHSEKDMVQLKKEIGSV